MSLLFCLTALLQLQQIKSCFTTTMAFPLQFPKPPYEKSYKTVDGKRCLAVLYTEGEGDKFGMKSDDLGLFVVFGDKHLVSLIERGSHQMFDQIKDYLNEKYEGKYWFYDTVIESLKIEWVPVGRRFSYCVNDLYEQVEILDENNWRLASYRPLSVSTTSSTPAKKTFRTVNGKACLAVICSEGYGAGFSTWYPKLGDLLVYGDDVLISLIEEGSQSTYREIKNHLQNHYLPGWIDDSLKQLTIEWVPVGTRFQIDEYDGYESVRILEDIEWFDAI